MIEEMRLLEGFKKAGDTNSKEFNKAGSYYPGNNWQV
jgi:hypothetical protein